MEHVGVVVDDLAAATEFFVELGFELQGGGPVEGPWVDRVVGLDGIRVEIAMLRTPADDGRLELIRFHSPVSETDPPPLPANVRGLRHIAFAVKGLDDVISRLQARGAELIGEVQNYEDLYLLCYLRGPAGIIVELAERIG